MGDFIARAQLKWQKTPPYPPNARVRNLDSVEGFDEAFERSLLSPADNKVALVQRTYMKKASDGAHYVLTAICDVTDVATACSLHFSLSCDSKIYVSVNGIDGSYLNRSAEIREKTDRFVSAMVRNPICNA
jgi:hypothetical protein